MKKKSNAGRKPIADEEKKVRLPLAAKLKHHEAIVEKFEPVIKRFENKLDKEVKQ